jgi:hypothetical protein
MYMQLLNPGTDPEKIFITVKNTYSTNAITAGMVVCWDYTTDADGIGVTVPTTALLQIPAGVVASASIAVNGTGLVQVYGHCTTVTMLGTTGTHAGAPLKPVNGQTYLDSAGITATGASYSFVCGETYTTGASAVKKCFIKCL